MALSSFFLFVIYFLLLLSVLWRNHPRLISIYPWNSSFHISAVKNGMENWLSSKTAHVVVGKRERLPGSALARQVDWAWTVPFVGHHVLQTWRTWIYIFGDMWEIKPSLSSSSIHEIKARITTAVINTSALKYRRRWGAADCSMFAKWSSVPVFNVLVSELFFF